jgi:hypothetical protein
MWIRFILLKECAAKRLQWAGLWAEIRRGGHLGGQPACAGECEMAAILPGYAAGLADDGSKRRYAEKLAFVGGEDPYELPKADFQDNVDAWPAVTCILPFFPLLLQPMTSLQLCGSHHHSSNHQ